MTAIDHLATLIATETDECVDDWPYFAHRGYPRVCVNGESLRAHRYVCELAHGAPPDPTMHAAHSCGNKGCLNPRHLRWATAAENIADKRAHGTAGRGDRHHHHKLTAAIVREIRERRATTSGKALASQYGVSTVMISRIKLGKSWRYPEAGWTD